jgi:hypothetical protein
MAETGGPPQPLTVTADELAQMVADLELAYEAVVFHSDRGRLDFEPFRPMTRVLRRLRQIRDELRAAA